jgi:hypothetical protein
VAPGSSAVGEGTVYGPTTMVGSQLQVHAGASVSDADDDSWILELGPGSHSANLRERLVTTCQPGHAPPKTLRSHEITARLCCITKYTIQPGG